MIQQKKINSYQQQINNAAIELALNDPNLLLSRQKLLELSRTKVNEGYRLNRGKSRSKHCQSHDPTPKRPKTTERLRKRHIGELEEEIKNLIYCLQFKGNRRDQAESSRNYKLCDQLMDEMSVLKKRK